MGQAWYCTGVRTLLLRESPDPPLGSDQVRVRTLYSGISAGTELTYYRGTNSRLHRRWDARLRLFRDGGGEWDEPGASGRLLGYEEVGEVVELGPDVPAGGVGVGAVVRGAWGHRTTTVMTAAHAAAQRLPAGLHPRHAVLGYIGGVALNGILDASIRVTESVAIFGLGVVGQLVAQLARLSGARVVAIDPVAFRREVAAALGAAATIDPAAEGGLRVTRAREEIAPYRRVLGSGASS